MTKEIFEYPQQPIVEGIDALLNHWRKIGEIHINPNDFRRLIKFERSSRHSSARSHSELDNVSSRFEQMLEIGLPILLPPSIFGSFPTPLEGNLVGKTFEGYVRRGVSRNHVVYMGIFRMGFVGNSSDIEPWKVCPLEVVSMNEMRNQFYELRAIPSGILVADENKLPT